VLIVRWRHSIAVALKILERIGESKVKGRGATFNKKLRELEREVAPSFRPKTWRGGEADAVLSAGAAGAEGVTEAVALNSSGSKVTQRQRGDHIQKEYMV